MNTAKTAPRARVYEYGVGDALNSQLRAAWYMYQRDLAAFKDIPNSEFYPRWIREDKRVLRALCAVRHAGRMAE